MGAWWSRRSKPRGRHVLVESGRGRSARGAVEAQVAEPPSPVDLAPHPTAVSAPRIAVAPHVAEPVALTPLAEAVDAHPPVPDADPSWDISAPVHDAAVPEEPVRAALDDDSFGALLTELASQPPRQAGALGPRLAMDVLPGGGDVRPLAPVPPAVAHVLSELDAGFLPYEPQPVPPDALLPEPVLPEAVPPVLTPAPAAAPPAAEWSYVLEQDAAPVTTVPAAWSAAVDPGTITVPDAARHHVELGFRDGSTTALDPDSEQALALAELSSLLTARN